MLINVANPDRIGWEVEIRTCTFVGSSIRVNGIVLAHSMFNIVDRGLNYNFLRIVSEGEGTGALYPELVFGPVPFDQIKTVRGIISAAASIAIIGGMTLKGWVDQLNVALATISPAHKLACATPYQTIGLKSMKGSATSSLQAKISVRLDSLTSVLFDRWFFGTSYDKLFPKIRNQVLMLGIRDGNLNGAVILATYICAVYAKLDCAMTDSKINKQFFHILPKTSLKQLFGDIPMPTAVTPANVAAALRALAASRNMNLFDMPGTEKQFYANLKLTDNYFVKTTLATMMDLHPRPSAIINTMSCKGICYIVMEMRKSTLLDTVYKGEIKVKSGVVEIKI